VFNKLADTFERKILFDLGRHFWNVVGIAGVVSLLTGGILFASSREIPVLTYEDWLKQEKGEDDQAVREIIGQTPVVQRWQSKCVDAMAYGDPQNYCDYWRTKKDRLDKFEGNLKTEYRSYSKAAEDKNNEQLAIRIASPLIVGWGFGTAGTASVISAILAVERNTRKRENGGKGSQADAL